MRTQFFISILFATLLMFTLWGCDEDPASADTDDAPEAPTIEEVEMDLSVFDDAETFARSELRDPETIAENLQLNQEDEHLSAYEQAAVFASSTDAWFQAFSQWPANFFREDQWGEPERDGDLWVWDWSQTFEGVTVELVITAEDVENERHWELRYTAEGTEEDDVENALLISYQEDRGGDYGTWQVYDFLEEPEVVAYEVEYQMDGDVTTSIDMSIEDGGQQGVLSYYKEDEISSLELFDLMGEGGDSLVRWNNEEGYGFIESPAYRDGERICWDENYENTDDCLL